MDEETWKRHANPLSVWTRMPIYPALILAVWSRRWIGWWSLLPITLVVVWTWLNPRIFSPPDSTDNWASKAVLGEKIWLELDAYPEDGHWFLPTALNVIYLGGVLLLAWGLYVFRIWSTVFGATISFLAKLWFVDRMVWLYERNDQDPNT
ncbi:MAG: DUF6653 family protein [bacterium]